MSRNNEEAVDVLVKEILKYIGKTVEEKINRDITFKSIVKKIGDGKYQILGTDGQTRTVKCCIPNVELKVGQTVWVKMPQGKLKDMHICGVA